jgi:hypothetical protein
MITEGAERGVDWHNPIPGDARLVQEEVTRLSQLRDCWRDSTAEFRALDVSTWQGAAADAFGSNLRRQLAQWSHGEQALSSSIDALADYLNMLQILQPRAREAVYRAQVDGTWQGAAEDILRWSSQVDAANHRAAHALRVATEELASIHRLVDPVIAASVARVRIAAGRNQIDVATPDDGGTTQRIANLPVAEQQSPAELLNRTAVLCDALLDAMYISADQL